MDSQNGQPEFQPLELLKKILGPKYVIVLPVLTVIALGLIFYFLVVKKQSGDSLQNQEDGEIPQQAQPVARPAVLEGLTFVILEPQNDSGQKGIASVSKAESGTQVVIDLTGVPQEATEPAHIHEGSCQTLGAVRYPLSDLTGGKSTTTLDITLDELKQQLPLAINVHKSAQEIQTYVACGDIK